MRPQKLPTRLPMVIAVVAILAMIAPVALAASDSAPTIALTPPHGTAGTTVTVEGANFDRGVDATLTFGSSLVTCCFRPNRHGRFTTSFEVPDGYAGEVTVTAELRSTKASATFRVEAPDAGNQPVESGEPDEPSENPAEERISDGLVALYDFGAGTEATVPDVSGVGSPIDLTIGHPDLVRWHGDGGLELATPTMLASTTPATKITDAVRMSNEITMEAWVTPANVKQDGPARILTISHDHRRRNLLLGQDGDSWEARLRTTATDHNGVPGTTSTSGMVTSDRAHLVFTRSSTGAAHLYIDGKLKASTTVGGDLSEWDAGYSLALGDELNGGRSWVGTLHLVAIYSRALHSAEVMQNLAAGPTRGGAGQPSTPQPTPDQHPDPAPDPGSDPDAGPEPDPDPEPTPDPDPNSTLDTEPPPSPGPIDEARTAVLALTAETASGCSPPCANATRIRVTDAEGEELAQVPAPEGVSDRVPRWSPDGSRLAFARVDHATQRAEIYITETGTEGLTTPRRVTNTSTANDGAGCGVQAAVPVWAPDSTRIAFECTADTSSEVRIVAADASEQFSVPRASHLADTSPSWSPASDVIAFSRQDSTVPVGSPDRESIWRVEVRATKATNQQRLVSGDRLSGYPRWSPVEDTILYIETDELALRSRLRAVPADGGSPTTLYTSTAGELVTLYEAVWSPDGSQLAFPVGDGVSNSVIHVLDIASGTAITSSPTDRMAYAPAWSPDGSDIIFDLVSNHEGVESHDVALGRR